MRYQANNFTIETPGDWQDRSIITFVAASSPNEFAANMVITKEAIDLEETSLENYAHRQFDIAQREVAGLKVLKQKKTTLSGRPGVEIIQRLSAHGLNLQQLQTFVLMDAEICVITCTATVGNFNQYLPRFRKILESFQINS